MASGFAYKRLRAPAHVLRCANVVLDLCVCSVAGSWRSGVFLKLCVYFPRLRGFMRLVLWSFGVYKSCWRISLCNFTFVSAVRVFCYWRL